MRKYESDWSDISILRNVRGSQPDDEDEQLMKAINSGNNNTMPSHPLE